MPGRAAPLRLSALLLLAAYAMHEARYAMAPGRGASGSLGTHGHGYLMVLGPAIATASALLLACGVVRAAASVSTPSGRRPRLMAVWPLAALALAAIFATQETVEGLLSRGHVSGVDAVFGNGGWLVLPLAVLFGGLVAAGAGIVQAAEQQHLVPVRVAGLVRSLPRAAAQARPATVLTRATSAALARHLAGRAPPVMR